MMLSPEAPWLNCTRHHALDGAFVWTGRSRGVWRAAADGLGSESEVSFGS
jgi:hypothetical protein